MLGFEDVSLFTGQTWEIMSAVAIPMMVIVFAFLWQTHEFRMIRRTAGNRIDDLKRELEELKRKLGQ